MLFSKFKKGQGLGNQLWNYVTLRSIANALSKDFRVLNFKFFKGKDFLEIDETNNPNKFYDENNLDIFYEELFYDRELDSIFSDYDSSILNIKNNVLLEGLFQSEKYLIPNRNIISKFIRFKNNNENNYPVEDWENTCILNIRGGEYKRHSNLILPKSYWSNAMQNIRIKLPNIKFKIVTDDENYVKYFLPNIEVIKGDIASDFYVLNVAKYIIISNSSFSYFPINLGNKPNVVIAPLYWSRHGNQFQRWCSPANFYEQWLWQNQSGEIINNEKIEYDLAQMRKEFNQYKLRSKINTINNEINRYGLIYYFKKTIKYILSLIFPLKFG